MKLDYARMLQARQDLDFPLHLSHLSRRLVSHWHNFASEKLPRLVGCIPSPHALEVGLLSHSERHLSELAPAYLFAEDEISDCLDVKHYLYLAQ